MPLNTLPIGWSTIISCGSVSTAIADDLGDREHADHQRDQPDAAQQLDAAEGEARNRRRDCPSPTHATSRPRNSETSPFSGRSDVMNTAQVSPSSTSQKYSNELNFSANSASVGRRDHQHRRAEQAADRGEHEARAQRSSACPLFVIAYASSV